MANYYQTVPNSQNGTPQQTQDDGCSWILNDETNDPTQHNMATDDAITQWNDIGNTFFRTFSHWQYHFLIIPFKPLSANISDMGYIGGQSPLVMPCLSKKSSFLVQLVEIGLCFMVKQKKSKVSLSSENLSQKVKKWKNLTKIHFFEILIDWDFDRFLPFLVNVWSKNLQIWPCFTLFCPLANWFEVLPLGTFPSIQSGPSSEQPKRKRRL